MGDGKTAIVRTAPDRERAKEWSLVLASQGLHPAARHHGDGYTLLVPESEVEAVRALVRERMEGALPLRVPLVVDVGVGRSWREAH